MSWYDDEYCDDSDYEEYMEERAEERDTKVRKKGETFKISFNAEQFATDIVTDVVLAIRKDLKEEVMKEIKEEVITEKLKQTMELETHAVVRELIDEFMQNEKITIGGNGFYDDTPRQEFTLMEYSKKCIGEAIKSGSFKVVKEKARNPYDRDRVETLNFEEYIQNKLAIGDDAKNYIDNFTAGIRDNVNKQIKETFDESMKNTLTSSLLQMLTANASYKKLNDEITRIASRNDEE